MPPEKRAALLARAGAIKPEQVADAAKALAK
jgi:hypothetical protein